MNIAWDILHILNMHIYIYYFVLKCIQDYILYSYNLRYIYIYKMKQMKLIINYIINCTFDIDFLKNLINLILFYVFNLTLIYNRIYIFHLYLFSGLFVYYILTFCVHYFSI